MIKLILINDFMLTVYKYIAILHCVCANCIHFKKSITILLSIFTMMILIFEQFAIQVTSKLCPPTAKQKERDTCMNDVDNIYIWSNLLYDTCTHVRTYIHVKVEVLGFV